MRMISKFYGSEWNGIFLQVRFGLTLSYVRQLCKELRSTIWKAKKLVTCSAINSLEYVGSAWISEQLQRRIMKWGVSRNSEIYRKVGALKYISNSR